MTARFPARSDTSRVGSRPRVAPALWVWGLAAILILLVLPAAGTARTTATAVTKQARASHPRTRRSSRRSTARAIGRCTKKTQRKPKTAKAKATKRSGRKRATRRCKPRKSWRRKAKASAASTTVSKRPSAPRPSGAANGQSREPTGGVTGSPSSSGSSPTPAPAPTDPVSAPAPPTGPISDPFTPQTATVTWDPLAEQWQEPDTLFLLDPPMEDTLEPGLGGLMSPNMSAGQVPWQSSGGVDVVPGKYREGLQSTARSNGYLWMPLSGYLPADQFTVEMWLKADVPWSQLPDDIPMAFVENDVDGIQVEAHSGILFLEYVHDQGAGGQTVVTLSYNAGAIPANTWTSVAFTYDAGTLILYVNGAAVASAQNVPAPQIWSDDARGSAAGLSIAGARGRGATDMTISDLRISRFARVPGQALTVTNGNTLTVDPSEPTGASVNQDLLGGLHTLGGPQTETMASGVLKVMRTDKLLNATPIEQGAPTATYPSAGVTGVYSYDWEVVDRTFAYFARLGLTPYISLDSTPQILGGSSSPFSGTALTTQRSYQASFNPQVPNSLSAWSDMIRDLVYHVTVQDGYQVPYWGVWNEPDGSFWSGTRSDYLALYKATATAVKSVNRNLQVGGPETASWDPTWVKALIDYCASNGLPLDFVSWHYYSGDLGEIAQARAEVAQWAQADGIPAPKLIIGEWAWQSHDAPGTGNAPFSSMNYDLNDWGSTFTAQSLMMMQANGVAESIFTSPVAAASGTSYAGSGLMSDTQPWGNLNVYRMWSMLEPDMVSSTYSGSPGMLTQASKGSDGALTIMLAYQRYRKDVSVPVSVDLPSEYAGATVHDYVVDAAHSDAWDAGGANANLEQLSDSTVSQAGVVHVMVAPRSVHLLVISPPA